MKKCALIVAIVASVFAANAGWVKGYYRSNGSYVAPHYRNSGGTSARSHSATPPSYRSSYNTTKTPYYQDYQRQTQGPRSFSRSMKTQKYNEQGGACSHCGRYGTMSTMEADHVVPYSKGGKTDYSNLQILCRPCNRSKGNRYSY